MENSTTPQAPTACPWWCASAKLAEHAPGPDRNHVRDLGVWSFPGGELSIACLREDRGGVAGEPVIRVFVAETGQRANWLDITPQGAALLGFALHQMPAWNRRAVAEHLQRAGLTVMEATR